ncbi:MAG TPA: DUF3352 domain-containing protein, partial [Pyrinomonadaceae bacterium]|nr:DUF3352 domain-containing protein [Pyrinomonadaceae bacterium]
QQTVRHVDSDLSIEEMLGADSYSVYMEFRRVGALAQTEEVKTAVASLTLFGGAETKPLTDLYRFISENEEALSEARVVTVFLPARPGLPQALSAVGLATPEAAAAFEPKYRRLLGEQMREVKKLIDPAGANTAPPPPQNTPGERQRGGAQPNARQGSAAKPPDFAFRRIGRWLVAADSAFTLKSLRGEEDAPRLSQSTRFQSVRSRFANESLFVYVDTTAAQAAWALQVQRIQEAQQQQQPEGPVLTVQDGRPVPYGVATTTTATTTEPSAQPTPEPSTEETQPEPSPDPSAEEAASQAEMEARAAEAEANLREHEESLKTAPTPPPPSEEELAVRGLSGMLRSLWGGAPRIPGAVALGVGLERGSLAVRLAVENTPDGTIALVPFLPNLVSGPPVTTRAAEVAPSDAALFFSGSLDWEQVYNSTLGAAALNPALTAGLFDGGDEDGPKRERQPSPDETIKAIEKVFGFKFREDLLPALGHEIAFSMPLDASDFGIPSRRGAEEEKKEERAAEPGFVLIISLNDPDKMREILPRVLTAFGIVTGEATWSQPEKRAGFELRAAGSFAYTTIGDFLVLGEPKAVRHCIDSYDARRTLAATNAYRDATDWQARQKLAHIFVSDSIARDIVEATRKRSGGSTDPAVIALLAQLETAETAPASYEATNEGDVVIHEMRLPFSLIKTYAAAVTVGVKDAPVLSNESMALYALQRIGGVESEYKDEKKKGRYGTLEELVAEGLLEKDFLQHMEYRVELTATSDKFEATATPKTYGKTGRRSFFVNESGKVRAADRKGEPATADDPTVEQ